MIDVIHAKQYFKEYVTRYDMENPRIRLKTIHTYQVAAAAKNIAVSLNLLKEDVRLAELIGLLHDIGRFEQWKWYQTFSDKMSIDHGEKGVEILFADREIRNFIKEDKFDGIIFKAISNHNKVGIERGLTTREILHCKIVKDADNVDIFRSFLESNLEDHTHFGSKNVSKEKLSEAFFEEFKQEKVLLYSHAKTDMDIMVAIIAHIFGVYFSESLKIIRENDYIPKIVKKINAQDSDTKKKLDEIVEHATNYIERRLEKI